MNTVSPGRAARAFTLLELLVTVAIIGILAALLLPALQKASVKARQVWCTSNLRQVGIGLSGFAHDHRNVYPQQLSRWAGGALESARSNLFFEGRFAVSAAACSVLSNELGNAQVLGCPATRRAPRSFAMINPNDLGFAFAMNASLGDANAPLALDRNVDLARSRAPAGGSSTQFQAIFWTPERHGNRGNALFADGHVEQRANLPMATPSSTGGRLSGTGTSANPGTGGLSGGRQGAGGGVGGESPGAAAPRAPLSPTAPPPASGGGSKFSRSGVQPKAHQGGHMGSGGTPATGAMSLNGSGAGLQSIPPLAVSGGGTASELDESDEESLSAKIRRTVLWIFLIIFLLGLGAVLFHAWTRYRAMQA